MSSRTATLQSGSFTWNDTTPLLVANGTTAQVDIYASGTTFATPPLVWVGGQPAGSSVTVVSNTHLLLSIPNSLTGKEDVSYYFYVSSAARAQTSNLTILLKGNPG